MEVVYQKAYAEFFCSPATWALLEEHLSKTPTVELMGVTRKGELKASHDTQVRDQGAARPLKAESHQADRPTPSSHLIEASKRRRPGCVGGPLQWRIATGLRNKEGYRI